MAGSYYSEGVCAHCGRSLARGAQFCSECGTQVGAAKSVPQYAAADETRAFAPVRPAYEPPPTQQQAPPQSPYPAAHPTYAQSGPPAHNVILPSLAGTIIVTLLFSVFGAIPAYLSTDRANSMGVHTGRYWKAFLITLVAQFLVLAATVMAGTAMLVNGINDQSTGYSPSPYSANASDPANLGSEYPSDAPATEPDAQTSEIPVNLPAGAAFCSDDSNDGQWSIAVAGNSKTSCGFAERVRAAYAQAGGSGSDVNVIATSDATSKTYDMTCTGSAPVVCPTGTGAQVLLYSAQ